MAKSISKIVKERIESLPEGSVITFSDFNDLENIQAVALSLSRMKSKGLLNRLEKGKYFIPKKTKFGVIGPSDNSILKGLLKNDDSTEAYISGVAAYNKLGLTTQVPNVVTIVGNMYNRKAEIGKLKVKYIKSKAPINSSTITILQILDAINDVKKIPDATVNDSIKRIKKIILELTITQKKKMVTLSRYYRPRVQAIVGEILEEDGSVEVQSLREELNPLTKFKLNISKKILPLQESWNLVWNCMKTKKTLKMQF